MEKNLVSDGYELHEFLKKEFGDRLSTYLIIKSLNTGDIGGTLDQKKITIKFKGEESLLIYTDIYTEDVLLEILPILSKAMGANPLCSYELPI